MDSLPELTTVDCSECNGFGFLEDSEFNPHECFHCDGTGEIEVCSSCFQVPEIFSGLEVCGCVQMAKAA